MLILWGFDRRLLASPDAPKKLGGSRHSPVQKLLDFCSSRVPCAKLKRAQLHLVVGRLARRSDVDGVNAARSVELAGFRLLPDT
jgi:hypothetical protein